MRVWPIILDSRPAYLRGAGRSESLLLAPIGARTVIEELLSALAPITENPVVVLSTTGADTGYRSWIHAVCPTARVAGPPGEFTDAVESHELSDAFRYAVAGRISSQREEYVVQRRSA